LAKMIDLMEVLPDPLFPISSTFFFILLSLVLYFEDLGKKKKKEKEKERKSRLTHR